MRRLAGQDRNRLSHLNSNQAHRRRSREEKQSLRPQRERPKPEHPVKGDRTLVLGVHHNGENSDGTPGAQDAANRIGQQELSHALPTYPLVACQPADHFFTAVVADSPGGKGRGPNDIALDPRTTTYTYTADDFIQLMA